MLFLAFLSTLLCLAGAGNVSIIAKSRSAFLDTYRYYTDAVVMHFNVPSDVSFASLKFTADEMDMSVLEFGCGAKDITMFVKYGSPPVINPEGAPFPKKFYFDGRPKSEEYTFKSDQKTNYVNITSPKPGNYFVALFNSYTNPNDDGIKQDGLTENCLSYVDFTLSVEKLQNVDIISNGQLNKIDLHSQKICYKFYIDNDIDHVILSIKNVKFCPNCRKLTVQTQVGNVPKNNESIAQFTIANNGSSTDTNQVVYVSDKLWYYTCFTANLEENAKIIFDFQVVYYTSNILKGETYFSNVKNVGKSAKMVNFEFTNATQKLNNTVYRLLNDTELFFTEHNLVLTKLKNLNSNLTNFILKNFDQSNVTVVNVTKQLKLLTYESQINIFDKIKHERYKFIKKIVSYQKNLMDVFENFTDIENNFELLEKIDGKYLDLINKLEFQQNYIFVNLKGYFENTTQYFKELDTISNKKSKILTKLSNENEKAKFDFENLQEIQKINLAEIKITKNLKEPLEVLELSLSHLDAYQLNKINVLNTIKSDSKSKKDVTDQLLEQILKNRKSKILLLHKTLLDNLINLGLFHKLFLKGLSDTAFFGTSKLNYFIDKNNFKIPTTYREYNLVRETSSDTFKYAFDLEAREEDDPILPLNLTSEGFTVLKFAIEEFVDSGGTIQFIAAFKPKLVRIGNRRIILKQNFNHSIVFCLKNGQKMSPTHTHCFSNTLEQDATFILNATNSNSSVLIPFPEPGNWYISAKLFCNGCEPCTCSETCKNENLVCVENCERTCLNNLTSCNNCNEVCLNKLLQNEKCSDCNCEGPCKITSNKCNASIIFDLSSSGCALTTCGKNGRCTFIVADGFIYTACLCKNNYRGWDCSDDSLANSYFMVVLELLLLVLSNLAFLPAVYFAYKRKYYVEATVYFCTCFFSTFYHACDAGENLISFCIAKLAVLQFSDFYVALLGLWVTMVAMAYLNEPLKSILHILGGIWLSFGTTYNKTSLWVFLLPVLIGFGVIIISWFTRYRKTRQLFPNKRYLMYYLPAGLLIVGVGLICYSFLQTRNNYKYLHSLWHILMAVGVIILLPDERSFLPDVVISNQVDSDS